MTRRGKPSKADLAERERRKKAWAREQEHHRQTQSQINQGFIKTISWEEAVALKLKGQLPDDVIVRAPDTPATEFVSDRIKSGSTEQQALIELLVSDVPLDQNVRVTIAHEMWRLMYPLKAKRDLLRAKVEGIAYSIAEAERRGLTKPEAYDQLAPGFGHKSGDALRKWLEKHSR